MEHPFYEIFIASTLTSQLSPSLFHLAPNKYTATLGISAKVLSKSMEKVEVFFEESPLIL
jgi:hypothetical protein